MGQQGRSDVVAQEGNLGVYQLADAAQQILFIGYAGGKSLFGLKGEILAAFQAHPTARSGRAGKSPAPI